MKLTIDRLTITYRTAAQTISPIRNLSLATESGELTLLHGPSGCGKTTLLSAIAGLLTPDEGSIRLDDTDVSTLTGRRLVQHRRRNVGMIFQSFNLLPSLTAQENVAAPLTLGGTPSRTANARARRILDDLGLGDRLDHHPSELSGGQQQRVAIARALATDPPIVLADEPTAHLDHTQVEGARSTLRKIADTGRIVIISTHDDRLTHAADRIARLNGPGTEPRQTATSQALRRGSRPVLHGVHTSPVSTCTVCGHSPQLEGMPVQSMSGASSRLRPNREKPDGV